MGRRASRQPSFSNGTEIKLRQLNPLGFDPQFGSETGSCPGILRQTPECEKRPCRTDAISWSERFGPSAHAKDISGTMRPRSHRTGRGRPEIHRIGSLRVFTQDAQGGTPGGGAERLFLMPGHAPSRSKTPELAWPQDQGWSSKDPTTTLTSLLLQKRQSREC